MAVAVDALGLIGEFVGSLLGAGVGVLLAFVVEERRRRTERTARYDAALQVLVPVVGWNASHAREMLARLEESKGPVVLGFQTEAWLAVRDAVFGAASPKERLRLALFFESLKGASALADLHRAYAMGMLQRLGFVSDPAPAYYREQLMKALSEIRSEGEAIARDYGSSSGRPRKP